MNTLTEKELIEIEALSKHDDWGWNKQNALSIGGKAFYFKEMSMGFKEKKDAFAFKKMMPMLAAKCSAVSLEPTWNAEVGESSLQEANLNLRGKRTSFESFTINTKHIHQPLKINHSDVFMSYSSRNNFNFNVYFDGNTQRRVRFYATNAKLKNANEALEKNKKLNKEVKKAVDEYVSLLPETISYEINETTKGSRWPGAVEYSVTTEMKELPSPFTLITSLPKLSREIKSCHNTMREILEYAKEKGDEELIAKLAVFDVAVMKDE